MYTCDDCTNTLLEYRFGLLDDDQVQQLRSHLDSCPACHQALVETEAEHGLIARAALVCAEVPPFTPPRDEPAAPAEATPTQPATVPLPVRRHSLRRWAGVAAAAALLLFAGAGYGLYRQGLTDREADVKLARQQVK